MADHVGLVIKRLREERKLSKSRLAREAGISDAYVVQIEQGQRNPSEDVLRRFARVLRVPPHHLLIPAGHYDPETLESARDRVDLDIAQARQTGHVIDDEKADRLLYRELEELDQIGRLTEAEYEMMLSGNVMAASADVFYGWNKPDAVWPAEGWDKLTDGDRRLVQQLITRLLKAEPEA